MPRCLPASSTSTSSEEAIECTKAWLTKCDSQHGECSSARGTVSGVDSFERSRRYEHIRFLEVLDDNLIPLEAARLCLKFPEEQYLTLSHCWGQSGRPRTCLLEDDIENLTNEGICTVRFPSFSIQNLPSTFKDAICFTQALGIRYIWIDALCIIQDSAVDWQEHATYMFHIYSHSYLNLAASSSQDSDGGLFRNRNPMELRSCLIDNLGDRFEGKYYRCVDWSLWRRKVSSTVLSTRAWVLQETMLAPRTLHFSSDQLFWECKPLFGSETDPEGVGFFSGPLKNAGSDRFGFEPHLILHPWAQVVREYTKRQLTYEFKDKLVAISGVARQVSKWIRVLDSGEYLAGLWRSTLGNSLLWYVPGDSPAGDHRFTEFSAPSWSWASVKGPIHMPYEQFEVDVEVLEAWTNHSTQYGDPFGPVFDGNIRLRGPLIQATLTRPVRYSFNVPDSNVRWRNRFYNLTNGTACHTENLELGTLFDDWSLYSRDLLNLFCLPFLPRDESARNVDRGGLLLEKVQNGRGTEKFPGGKGTFRRIGIFRLTRAEADLMLRGGKNQVLDPDDYADFDGIDRYTVNII